MIEGNLKDFIADRNSIVISKEFKNKIFGDESAIGKSLRISDGSDIAQHTIALVVEVPKNSHIQFDILKSIYFFPDVKAMKQDWGMLNCGLCNYIKLKPNAMFTKKKIKELCNIVKNNTGEDFFLEFQALEDIHLHTNFHDPISFNNSNILYPRLLSLGMVLILLITILNYAVIDISRSVRRTQSMALKRIIGAGDGLLFVESLADALFLTLIALLLSVLFTWSLLPWFYKITGSVIPLNISIDKIIFVALLLN